MFKKPLGDLKTSAPLRSSDRRKLKQRVVSTFGITPEDGDLVVPDGILSVKFKTHLDEPGVAYLAPNGDPLWFTVGHGNEDLVPTIYTLWKKGDFLPFLSTPAAVIPILVGGADLMIPGVRHCAPSINAGELVCVRQYQHLGDDTMLSPALAVGRMALPGSDIHAGAKSKGKAVHILHAWKDHLWDMGSKGDMPAGIPLQAGSSELEAPESDDDAGAEDDHKTQSPSPRDEVSKSVTSPASPTPASESHEPTYTPQEVSELLTKSLLEAISSTLSSLPPSAFPMAATAFYTNHILPARPAYPSLVLKPSSVPSAGESETAERVLHLDPQQITIKSSSYKSLTAFLKSAEKASLITLKSPPKNSKQGDLLISGINASNPAIVAHTHHVTVKQVEQKAAKQAEQAEKAQVAVAVNVVTVSELWKPFQASVDVFTGMGAKTGELYTAAQIRSLVLDYITKHSLINARRQEYVNLDDLLKSCVFAKLQAKPKKQDKDIEPESEMQDFMRRAEVLKRITNRMQPWHEVSAPGFDVVLKKGALAPIKVEAKIRQGRKVSTLISGFEPFLVLNADEMMEDLRKICAGATSVSQPPGKPANSGLEVLVQGNQSVAVVKYLVGKGIPEKWISVTAMPGKK